MDFLADENVPLASVLRLREAGHTVLAIAEKAPGVPDSEVLALAIAEDAVLLTFDRDYGELVYRNHAPTPRGIIFFRGAPKTPVAPAEQILQMLAINATIIGHFTVVDGDLVRHRPLS